ncbi:MAG: carbohydrate ABC transporter permease [Bacilli bacterium]|nr:carbohydrate ABC transporter permease [Bacilli bacterium]
MRNSTDTTMVAQNNKLKFFKIIAQILLYIICIFVAVMVLFPLLSLLLASTHSSTEIMQGFSFTIGNSFFDNWNNLMKELGKQDLSIIRSFFNSCIISFASTSLCIYFSSLTAYACHAYNFKGKAFFEKFILFLIIIPGQLGAVGFYALIVDMNLLDTYIPFIVPAICSASTVFFIRQYLRANFSTEFIDAARMDGASEFRIFNTICLPYIKPALATMALFGIISSWNSFMGPMMFLTEPQLYTLPQILYFLTSMQSIDYGAVYMGVLITILPMLLVYFFLSKTIMAGVSNGGLK